MFKNLFNRFFPTPQFLSIHSFGLDISDESIKFIELIFKGNNIKVGRYGERKIPLGVIESGKIKDSKSMKEILISLKKEEGIKAARVSLPEEQIYLFKIKLEKLGLKDIREGIELSLEEHIPMQAQDVVFDFIILNENDQNLECEVTAVPKNVIDSYLNIFESSSIQIISFELEAEAIARAVIKKGDPETYMIVDFGEKRTGISIVSNGTTMFASTVDVGGIMLTNLIQKNFKTNFEEAEKMKVKYGLGRNTENKEMFSVLLNGVSILRDEISKHFIYWHTYKENEIKDRPPIKKIILCGGDASLIGLSEYLSVSMKNTVEVANVWENILDTKTIVPEIGFNQSLSFTTAIGLALANF